MDKQQFHEEFQRLHAELQQIESVDEPEREMLRRLAGDIQALLSRDAGAPPDAGLGQRLRESIELLEASHPRTTMIMGQIADALAKMGI